MTSAAPQKSAAPQTSASPQYEVLETMSPVDRVVFGDVWSLPDDPQTRLALVRDALALHLAKCPKYARFAARAGFKVDDLREPADLHLVPQIPTLAFKLGEPIMSCDPRDVAKRCASSGTLGRRSEVFRDRTTIERLLGSVQSGVDLIGDWHDDDTAMVNLGPDQHEAGDLWFAYCMSLVELIYPTMHTVRNGQFDPNESLAVIRSLQQQYATVVVIGPPVMVLEVVRAASNRQRAAIEPSLFVVTAGGWKRSTGAILERDEFNSMVVDGFGLADVSQVRDAYNQVELNTVMLECRAQRKHVPPSLEVIIRNPFTLEPAAPGESGLISYLDPTATSYPCFIISDDVGTLHSGPCECGWQGRTLKHERRVKREEEWGCALKMDRDYTIKGGT